MPNFLLDPSAHGYPDATNTGVPPTANLNPSGPVVTSAPGQVIEDLEITGDASNLCVEVRHPNVLIRRCRFIGHPAAGGVKQVNGATGMVIQDCEGFCTSSDGSQSFIGENDYLAERVWLHDVPEGFRLFGDNAQVRDSFVEKLWIDNPLAHGDCAQSVGGSAKVLHNTFIGDWHAGASERPNAALIVGTEFAGGSPILDDNLLDGGGFTLQFGQSGAFVFVNPIVVRNRFGRGFGSDPGEGGYFGPFSNNATLDQMAGLAWYNIWDDDERLIPTGFPSIKGGVGLPTALLLAAGAGVGFPGVVTLTAARTYAVLADIPGQTVVGPPRYLKDPEARLDFGWDWRTFWLDDSEVIEQAEVYASGVTLATHEHDDSVVTAWVHGGMPGTVAALTCRVTTNHGRIDERQLLLVVNHR